MDALKINRIQVDRVGKNATDNRLLLDAGGIWSYGLTRNAIRVFVLVSGDGDFASACQAIQESGSQVIVIGNREITSTDLEKVCDKFYPLEDLERELSDLKKLHPISPSEMREFFIPLLRVYHRVADKDYDWVSYSQLGHTLRKLIPNYDSRFGKYKLSEWLRHFDKDFESHEQMVRRIDRNPEGRRLSLLMKAYRKTKQPDGWASLGAMGHLLRELDHHYESRFSGKKLSAWIADYPETFEIHENHVIDKFHR